MKKILIFSLFISCSLLIGSHYEKQNTNYIENDLLESAIGFKEDERYSMPLKYLAQENSEIEYSKMFVQTGSNSTEDCKYLRFATAVKGDISNIKFVRHIEAKENQENVPEDKEVVVDTIYKGISANGQTYYYNGSDLTTDEAEFNDFYWACYTIKYQTDKFKDNDISVSMYLNEATESIVDKETSLKNEIEEPNEEVSYTYTLTTEDDLLKIKGKIDNACYYGKIVRISWFFKDEESVFDYGKILDDGSFEVDVDLKDLRPLNTNGFAHFSIMESESNNWLLYGGLDKNLEIHNTLKTDLVQLEGNPAGNDISDAIHYLSSEAIDYYFGVCDSWGRPGLMAWSSENVEQFIKSTSLEVKNDTAYLVYSGVCAKDSEVELKLGINFQHNSDLDDCGWSIVFSTNDENLIDAEINEENGLLKFKFYVPISQLGAIKPADGKQWVLTPHYDIGGNGLKDLKNEPDTDLGVQVEQKGVKYSLRRDGATWDITSLVIERISGDANISVNNPSLEEVEGKAMFVINGNYSSELNEEELKYFASGCIYFDLQANQYAVNEQWVGNWTRHQIKPQVKFDASDYTFKIYGDISELDNFAYTTHFAFFNAPQINQENGNPLNCDYKPSEAINVSKIVGNKEYVLEVHPGSGDGKEFWGCAGLWVKDASN